MFIATLVAADRLQKGELNSAADQMRDAGCDIAEISEILDDKAADIRFTGDAAKARCALDAMTSELDFAVQNETHRTKKLLISDMDSTMITVECIDELAHYAGIKDQISEITERAMQGELDFEQALRGRVQLLAGLDVANIERCLAEKVNIMPGARTLVRTMGKYGTHTVLVSGGFTSFAQPVANEIGFAEMHANILQVSGSLLTGKLDGKIVDAQRKADILQAAIVRHDLKMSETLAVGDGANDIPMIELAGLGVAYHAKPKAAKAADAVVKYGDLTALLYFQGIKSADWAES